MEETKPKVASNQNGHYRLDVYDTPDGKAIPVRDLYSPDPQASSVVSSPTRCPLWGDSTFRGNCDGKLVLQLIHQYEPASVADPMQGSGTTRDVCYGLCAAGSPVDYWGSDLRQGFDLFAESLPGKFDLVFLHPPYWNMIRYNQGDRRCLSSIEDYEDFIDALHLCLSRCFDALNPGGHLAILLGHVRRRGAYFPIVRDVLRMEGQFGPVVSWIVKTQHNCTSDSKRYGRLQHARIAHEDCVVFEKAEPWSKPNWKTRQGG